MSSLYTVDFVLGEKVFHSGEILFQHITRPTRITIKNRPAFSSDLYTTENDINEEGFEPIASSSNTITSDPEEDIEEEDEEEKEDDDFSSSKDHESSISSSKHEESIDEKQNISNFVHPAATPMKRTRGWHAMVKKEDPQFYAKEIAPIQHYKKKKKEDKIKIPLTEEEMAKKKEIALKRRLQSRKHQEEMKKQTLDKILHETSKRQREKDRKLKKDLERKNELEEKEKARLHNCQSAIHFKYTKNLISVSFPTGFLLPKILTQERPKLEKLKSERKCDNCDNLMKYRCSKTQKCSCSLECYKTLLKAALLEKKNIP